jgi:hypothetical protein
MNRPDVLAFLGSKEKRHGTIIANISPIPHQVVFKKINTLLRSTVGALQRWLREVA